MIDLPCDRRSILLCLTWPALFLGLLFVRFGWTGQDFPINDDWSYARSVFGLYKTGNIEFGNWATVPQLGLWLLTLPFLSFLGLSFTTLRVVGCLVSGLSIIAIYGLLRYRLRASNALALLSALSFALHPLVLAQSATYMTDMPALALSLLSMLLLTPTERSSGISGRAWVIGVMLGCLAIATRQNALALAGALVATPLLAWLWPRIAAFIRTQNKTATPLPFADANPVDQLAPDRPHWRQLVAGGLIALVGVVAIKWFQARADINPNFNPQRPTAESLLQLLFPALQLGGLAVLPLLVQVPSLFRKSLFWIIMFGLIGISLVFARKQADLPIDEQTWLFPYRGNVLTAKGLVATDHEVGVRPTALALPTRLVFDLLGKCGAAGLLVASLELAQRRTQPGLFGFFFAGHLALLCLSPYCFDRYFITLIPSMLAGVVLWIKLSACDSDKSACASSNWSSHANSYVSLTLVGLLSLALVHDYFAQQQARWQLARNQVARGVKPRSIDAGIEWAGWHCDPSPYWHEMKRGTTLDIKQIGLTPNVTNLLFRQITGEVAISHQPNLPSGAADQPPKSTNVLAEQSYFTVLTGWQKLYCIAEQQR